MPEPQTPIRERRALHIEVRDFDKERGEVTIIPMVYDVEDSYSTTWAPGTFKESLESGRTVPYVWSHDWTEPIGRTIDYEDGKEFLLLRQKFDNFTDVPRARQAYAQLKSGTLNEHSVGFTRREWISTPTDKDPWAERMIKADLDEVSIVLAGAVPGTKTVSMRSHAYIDRATAADAVRSLSAGTLNLDQALAMLGLPPIPAAAPAVQRASVEEVMASIPGLSEILKSY